MRQITDGNCNDVDPCYLPDGRIAFCSDRAGYQEYYHQERSRVIYVMNADGTGIEQITFNPNQDYEPLVLRDGRVLYGSYRFYAQDGSEGPLRGEWMGLARIETVLRAANPDGSADNSFYGSMRGSFYSPHAAHAVQRPVRRLAPARLPRGRLHQPGRARCPTAASSASPRRA